MYAQGHDQANLEVYLEVVNLEVVDLKVVNEEMVDLEVIEWEARQVLKLYSSAS